MTVCVLSVSVIDVILYPNTLYFMMKILPTHFEYLKMIHFQVNVFFSCSVPHSGLHSTIMRQNKNILERQEEK